MGFFYDAPFAKNDTIRFFNPEKMNIEKVIYNDPATIVFWNDGTKTVVKCHECDEYDPKIGLLYCIAKKHFGGGRYNDVLAKHLPKAEVEVEAEDDFDWDKFLDGKFAVQCLTEKDAQEFLKRCQNHGYNWPSRPATDHTNWQLNGKDTCYFLHNVGFLGFASRTYYEGKGVAIVVWGSASEFDWKGFENHKFIVKCNTLGAALKFNELCEARGLEGLDACAIRLIHKVRGAVHYIGAYGNIYFQNPYSICDFPVKEWK